jgi:hypothetical protein
MRAADGALTACGCVPGTGYGAGSAPSCRRNPRASLSDHFSAILPFSMRWIAVPVIVSWRPVAGIPGRSR